MCQQVVTCLLIEPLTSGVVDGSDDGCRWRSESGLYCVRGGQRCYLTAGFTANSPSWPAPAASVASDGGVSEAELASAFAAQLPASLRPSFTGVAQVPQVRQQVVEVPPAGGTLVLFDSVTVPHEVIPVTDGERLAVAGWFHEPTQQFPEWYGT